MKIAIIGCGNMGKALALRLSTEHQLFLYDHNAHKTAALEKHGKACSSLSDALKQTETVILAIKPQNLAEFGPVLAKEMKPNQTLISILAGTTTATLRDYFPSNAIVRMMPNLAMAYGAGLIALTSDKPLSSLLEYSLTNIGELLGHVYWLPENEFDAFTSLTASGPAFFYLLMESMVEASVQMGLSPSDANALVPQMIQGSLTLLEKTGEEPAELIRQIASPGGMTMAGLKKFKEKEIHHAISEVFGAAYARAKELA